MVSSKSSTKSVQIVQVITFFGSEKKKGIDFTPCVKGKLNFSALANTIVWKLAYSSKRQLSLSF